MLTKFGIMRTHGVDKGGLGVEVKDRNFFLFIYSVLITVIHDQKQVYLSYGTV